MSRNYYVVKKDGQWRVKLESGPYLSTHRSQKAANRGVTVNAAAGYTRFSIGKDEV